MAARQYRLPTAVRARAARPREPRDLHEGEGVLRGPGPLVGIEGLVGIAFFMGGDAAPTRAVVQSAGYAYRLLGRRLQEEFHQYEQMQLLLLRFTQALITQMAQTAVCNRYHSVDQ